MKLGHWSNIANNNREDVITALMDIANHDADFNGENGADYLWGRAEGFESNAEYVLSVAENEPTITKMIEKFVSEWLDNDYYYADYDLSIDELDGVIAISIAYVVD